MCAFGASKARKVLVLKSVNPELMPSTPNDHSNTSRYDLSTEHQWARTKIKQCNFKCLKLFYRNILKVSGKQHIKLTFVYTAQLLQQVSSTCPLRNNSKIFLLVKNF